MSDGRRDEFVWRDSDDMHGRVIGYEEVRLEQGTVPDEVAGAVEVGRVLPGRGRDTLIEAEAAYFTADEAIQVGLVILEAGMRARAELSEALPPDLPEEIRWRLHVLAASINDSTFWVQDAEDNGYRATEVETGITGAWAATPEDALSNYFAGQFKHDEEVSRA